MAFPAHTETTTYSGAQVIDHAPYTISAPGVYVLTAPLSVYQATGNIIQVNADDVIIDLNGYTITNNYLPTIQNGCIGILGNNCNRLTVRNGTVRGCWAGVYLYSNAAAAAYPYGSLIEDLSLCEQTNHGVVMYATDSIARNVRVMRILGQESGQPNGVAFEVNGASNRILNCDIGRISNAGGGGSSVGIYFAYATTGGCAIGNRINPNFPGGVTQGIITNEPTVKRADNLVAAGVTYPYVGGTDAGNNHPN